MSKEHLPVRLPDGTRVQSGIPARSLPDQPARASGLLLKGVVTATYEVDSIHHFQNDLGRTPEGALSVYCDVLSYTNIPGMRWRFIPRCLVLQDRGGIHNGRVWKPRATKIDVSSGLDPTKLNAVDLNQSTNPANMDGDHVLVGFVNDQLNEPIILGGIPHPSVDLGAETSVQRQRLQLKEVDGDPDFWKHHGSKYGIATNGDFTVDTRFANNGDLLSNGKEKDAPVDGSGAVKFDLPLKASQVTTLSDMSTPEVPVVKVTQTLNEEKSVLQFDTGVGLTISNLDGKVSILFASGFEFLINDTTKIVSAIFPSGFEFVVDDGTSLIHAGGTGDWASADSLLQTELARLKDDFYALRDEVGRLLCPLPEFPMPIMFGDILSVFKAPLVYIAPGQAPLNIRTGKEASGNNAPMSITTATGEFIPDFLRPGESGVFVSPTNPGNTASDTLKIKS